VFRSSLEALLPTGVTCLIDDLELKRFHSTQQGDMGYCPAAKERRSLVSIVFHFLSTSHDFSLFPYVFGLPRCRFLCFMQFLVSIYGLMILIILDHRHAS
jgi:hypothetical protein